MWHICHGEKHCFRIMEDPITPIVPNDSETRRYPWGIQRRVPTRPGKPGKMRVHLENLEISWNFEKFNKYHGKMT